jgi:hypothetical protein
MKAEWMDEISFRLRCMEQLRQMLGVRTGGGIARGGVLTHTADSCLKWPGKIVTLGKDGTLCEYFMLPGREKVAALKIETHLVLDTVMTEEGALNDLTAWRWQVHARESGASYATLAKLGPDLSMICDARAAIELLHRLGFVCFRLPEIWDEKYQVDNEPMSDVDFDLSGDAADEG